MKISQIYFITLSLINILILNLYIIFQKFFIKKIMIFFHPRKDLRQISDYYINPLFNSKYRKNHKLYILENLTNFRFAKNIIQERHLKLLIGVDIFFNNYLCNTFPKHHQKIYIHHDIYDTPITNRKVYRELKDRLIKYDYILLPSIKSKSIFDDLGINFYLNNIKFEYIGYFKLDLFKKIKKIRKKTNKIVIAPTNFLSFPSMSLYQNIYKIINIILKNSNFDVILRPHPSNFESSKIKSIIKRYKNNKRFFLDKSKNYFNIYNNSDFLISDLSGTAYTYSIMTRKPVIFYSNYERNLKNLNYQKLNFFKDRKKIGYVVDNQNLLNIINNNKKTSFRFKEKQNEIINFFYKDSTKKRLERFINKIL